MLYEYALFLLTIFPMSLSTEYLEANYLPIYTNIKAKLTESFICLAHDCADIVSHPSVWIQYGNEIEAFWNKVISDSERADNLIEESNMCTVNGAERQIDHFFQVDQVEKWYLECKNNLAFDSQKTKAANLGIQELVVALNAQVSGYFCPMLDVIPNSLYNKYKNKGITVYGVKDILEVVDAPFTCEEYFAYIKQCKPLWRELLGVETVQKVSRRVLHGNLDLL